jgi:hypothetical protein
MATSLNYKDKKQICLYLTDLWNDKIQGVEPPTVDNRWTKRDFIDFIHRRLRIKLSEVEFRDIVNEMQTREYAALIAPGVDYYFTDDPDEIEKAIEKKRNYIVTTRGTIFSLQKSAGKPMDKDLYDAIEESINPSDDVKKWAEFLLDIFSGGRKDIPKPTAHRKYNDPLLRRFIKEEFGLDKKISDPDWSSTTRYARLISDEGVAILSNSRGYWAAADRYEILQTVQLYEGKRDSMMGTIIGLEKLKGRKKKKNGKLF